MDKEYKRDLLRKFSPYTEVDKLSDEEVDKLYKVWKENFLAWSREFTSCSPVGFSTARPIYHKSTYQREMELISGLPRIPGNNERIHFPNTPEVQKILKDMSNMCCNCRRKLNRELSDEDDAFDSIVLGLYLSSRTRPKPEPLTEQQLEKLSEQMDEKSKHLGERSKEEVREMCRHEIKKCLIELKNLHNTGFLPDSVYKDGMDRLRRWAERNNIEDFENLPYQETEDYIEKDNKKLVDTLSGIFKEAGLRFGD